MAELLEGSLTDDHRRRAEDHIDQCESCRSLVASLATRLSLILPSKQSASMEVAQYAPGWVSSVHGEAPHSARSLRAGEQIDAFRIKRLLGRGGMGEVYLAEHTKLGRQVAIKVVSLHMDTDNALERFMAEARATAQLNHPHVVTIHRVGEYQGKPYLALEYVQGQSLRRWLNDHPGTALREGLALVLAVAEALVAAHRRSILHRDLKPENVLIDDDGRVRVVDFGLAVSFAAAEEVDLPEADDLSPGAFFTGIVGTPRYMAPEQWTEEDQAAGVDIWAVGVILYELVTGGLHPAGESNTHGNSVLRLAAVTTSEEPLAPPPASSETPPALLQLLERCLDKDPTGRPTAAQVVAELSGLLAAPEPQPLRNRWLGLGAAVAGGALLVGLALLLVPDRDVAGAPTATQSSPTTTAEASTATTPVQPSATPAPTGAASGSSAPTGSAQATPSAPRPPLPTTATTARPTVPTPGSAPGPKDPLDRW
ncbi:MAG: protein kinase [Deltaproteobacteria bacterium]|nr:protein kinase [Deltaproteobacteria bacterium]